MAERDTPWNRFRCAAVNSWQADKMTHPLTCGNCSGNLVPATYELPGMYDVRLECPVPGCGYTQDFIPGIVLFAHHQKELTRLREENERLRGELKISEGFHKVAVRQRDNAWRENEVLREHIGGENRTIVRWMNTKSADDKEIAELKGRLKGAYQDIDAHFMVEQGIEDEMYVACQFCGASGETAPKIDHYGDCRVTIAREWLDANG